MNQYECTGAPDAIATELTAEGAEAGAAIMLADHVLRGGTWGDAYGCTAEEYEALYTVGHELYAHARYEDARQVFSLLFKFNNFDRRFPMALAASQQMLELHEQALVMYSVASMMDMEDPLPTFHSCQCLLALGRTHEAVDGLDSVIEQCRGDRYRSLRERSESLKELINAKRSSMEGVVK